MSFLKRLFGKKGTKLEDFPPINQALKKGKHVFAYLYSQSCLVCKKTTPMVEELESQYPNLQVLKILVDPYPEKDLRKHGIVFTPTLALFGQNGEALHRSVGLIEKSKLVELFEISKENSA